MQNTFHYGEIVAKITAQLHYNLAHRQRIEYALRQDPLNTDSIWTLCADAGRVFDTIEDLSSDAQVDWRKALNGYSREVLNHLLAGQKPDQIDLLTMASRSIENAR